MKLVMIFKKIVVYTIKGTSPSWVQPKKARSPIMQSIALRMKFVTCTKSTIETLEQGVKYVQS